MFTGGQIRYHVNIIESVNNKHLMGKRPDVIRATYARTYARTYAHTRHAVLMYAHDDRPGSSPHGHEKLADTLNTISCSCSCFLSHSTGAGTILGSKMVGMYPEGRCSLGDDCFCPAGELRPKYKCKLCGEQLHNVAQICADVYEDDAVMCKVNFGCNVPKHRSTRAWATS
jgi:hypothetical protein